MIDVRRHLAAQFVHLFEFLVAAYGRTRALADTVLQRARLDYLAATQVAA